MTAFRVTPPEEEEEEAEVDGAEWAEGVVVLVRGHFSRSWASLRLTNIMLMAPMIEKWGDSR